MAYVANFYKPAPFAIVTFVSIASLVISVLFLPDTKGQELMQQKDIDKQNS